MPLSPDTRRDDTPYCQHCTNQDGSLRSREVVHQGIAWWLKSWQEGLTDEQASERAAHFMKALPAWADTTP